MKENPLLEYAASNWGHHAYGNAEEFCKEIVLEFLEKKLNVALASQVLFSMNRWQLKHGHNFAKDISGMHLLAYFGLEMIMLYWLQKGARADMLDSDGHSPLWYASRYGQDRVVQRLLTVQHVDVNLINPHGQTPLLYCAFGKD